MGEEREHPEHVTDEELARRRRAKYGAMPTRVAETELVETTDPEPAREEPPAPQVRREWG